MMRKQLAGICVIAVCSLLLSGSACESDEDTGEPSPSVDTPTPDEPTPVLDVGERVTIAEGVWDASVAHITTQTSLPGLGPAPAENVYVTAQITLTNPTDAAELGYVFLESSPGPSSAATPFALVIPKRNAGILGIKTMSFTGSNASDWTGPGEPPFAPQCIYQSEIGDVPIPTYGPYCDLGRITDYEATVMYDAEPPNGSGGFARPRIAPGQSQNLFVFVGPLWDRLDVSKVDLLATEQGSDANGFVYIP
jgi:hypothetical protein